MNREETRVSRMLYELQRYIQFFALVAFVVTCCMMLFLTTMSRAMEIDFTADDIQLAAKITLGNVFLLTMIFMLIDHARRRHMVERPVRQITEAAERIIAGDFAVRIPPLHSLDRMNPLQDVADCMNHMAMELSGMETLRTDFIANVSHELKTPLTVIKNYARMLETPGLPEETRVEYARAIGETSRVLADLITNILRLNKLENQQIYPQTETFDLGEQLCECLLGFEDAWEKKGLEIETDVEDGVLVALDAQLLTLVWNNLFSNAIKFTAPGGTVSLTLKAEGDMAVVRVADTGCGFGAEVGAHIFEKFYQGDPSRATQGNGLGLALVRRVVDIVGGDIAVESEVGRGTAFTVKIGRKTDGAV